MGKIANITIQYYNGNYDLGIIYESILKNKEVLFFENSNYILVDYTPHYLELSSNNSISNFLLETINEYSREPITFSLLIKDIITHHTLNAVESNQINIAISSPLFLKNINIPDFSYYLAAIIPYFMIYPLEHIECSYG